MKIRSLISQGVLYFMLAVSIAAVAGAQTSLGTSTVGGTVRDPGGQLVSGAQVTLVDLQHGTNRQTTTNGEGGYQIPGVLPGVYSVKVEQTGFKTTTVANVQVIIDQVATVNAILSVGEVTQMLQVDAQGSTPLLDTGSNSLGGVIDNQRVEQLPLNGRNFLQLAALVGGTQPNTVSNQTGHNDTVISVAGASQWLTGYYIDGVATRSPRLGNSSLNISVAAVDQFKIELGFFLPDKGPQVGIVDVLTKSGNNRFHGEIYEYVRNPYMNAHKYFDYLIPHQKDSVKRNQFGLSVGGPVVIPKLFNGRDKLWFFGNYEGTRQITRSVESLFTPSAANFGGDFSNLATPIYNPFSYNATTKLRDPFQGNMIPSNLINPISKALLAYYTPGSATPTAGISLAGLSGSTLRDDQFTIRLDNTLSQRQSMYFDYSHQNSPVVNGDLLPLKGLGFPLYADLGVLQHTFTLTSRMLNIFRLGFDHAYVYQTGQGQGGPAIETQIGIPGTLDPHGIPASSITGYTSFGNAYSRVGEVANAYSLNDALNYTRGTHNLSLGLGFVYHRVIQQNANAGAVGSLAFQGNYTKQYATATTFVPNTGNAFADFLLGLPQSGSVAGFQQVHYYFSDYYPYVQDSWRVTPNFTVNYGLAWYFSSLPNPQGGDALLPHSFDFTTGLLKYAALGQVSPEVANNDYNNFMPRLGFAWAPSFDHNTTVRAAAGVYYGQLGLNDIQYGVSAPPFSNSFSFTNSATADLPALTLGNGVFPVITYPALTPGFAASLPAGSTFNIFDVNNRTPYMSQWTASVQHTFGQNDLIQVDYIGNSGHKNPNRYEYNQCPYRTDLFCDNTKKPYLNYGAMSYVPYSTNTSYEAMIAKYQHQVTHGLTLLANFTWQKALSDGFEPNTGAAVGQQISGCHRCEKGPTTYNIPLSFVTSAVYDLPFGKNRMFGNNAGLLKNALIGGWRLSVIGRMDHGNAIDVTAANQTSSTNARQRANRVPGCNANDHSIGKNIRTNGHVYINTACYAVPTLGYFGTAGKGTLFNPGQDTWDAALEKGLEIHENWRLELRGDFFNVFNHANFTSLDANASDFNANPAQNKFGLVTATRDPRIIQVSGTLRF